MKKRKITAPYRRNYFVNVPKLVTLPLGRAGVRYPGFPRPASELIEFLCGIDFVVVATTKKLVVRHNATDTAPFRQWLTSHGIPDITDQAGKAIIEVYTHIINQPPADVPHLTGVHLFSRNPRK